MIFIALGLVFAVLLALAAAPQKNAVCYGLIGVAGLAAGTALAWLMMPTLAWGHWDLLFFLVLPLIAGRFLRSDGIGGHVLVGGLVILVLGAAFVSTTAMFHADDYRVILQVTEEESFDPSSILLDQSQARLVDQPLAARAGHELLGHELGMGSRYEIGTMRIQRGDDGLVWVAPFQHKSFFRWLSNATAPGYIRVSAADYSDAEMVTEDAAAINVGVDGFWFGDYLPRRLYRAGYNDERLTDYTLELDEQGRPHWVVSMVEPTVGFSGYVTTGVLVIDAGNGEISEYSVEDAPAWVDRIQPEWVIDNQISNWGVYVDGWLNAVFVQDSVVERTPGTALVYTRNGEARWYTGLQSAGSGQQGTMGFMLTDTRTGETTFYRRAGITESAARSALEGRVQEYAYRTTQPIPYNVNGVNTFVSVLKDRSGNPQQIGMVAYDDRSIAAVGDSLTTTARRYTAELNASADASIEAGMEMIELEGTIDRIGYRHTNEGNQLHFTLADEPRARGHVFSASASDNLGAIMAREGDRVRIRVLQLERAAVTVREFENLALELVEGNEN